MIGTSSDSFASAADNAVDRAEETVENIHWVEVDNLGIEIASVDNRQYQAEATIAFEVTEE